MEKPRFPAAARGACRARFALAGAALGWALAAATAWAQAPANPANPANPASSYTQQAREVMNLAAAQLSQPGARVEVEVGELDPRLQLAPCAEVQAYLPAHARAWGRTRVGLRCVQGDKAWNVSLPVVVKVFAEAPVLQQALPGGTVLKAEHLTRAVVDWAAQPEPPLVNLQALQARQLAHTLNAGSAVRATDLKVRQWFATGDTVRVEARGNGFSVGTSAQALGPGLEGQRVRVRTDTGQVLSGQAVGAHRVEVVL